MSWEKVKLGDLAFTIQPGPFGTQLHRSDYAEEGIPIIMPKDMSDGKILHDGLLRMPEDHVNRLSRHQVHIGNLMVARKGDVRKCVYITEHEEGWMTGSDCLKVDLDCKRSCPLFIFYQLRSPFIGKWMEQISIGATMPSLNSGLLSSIEIKLPDISTQRRIADILSAYDALIENNHQQIKLLEEAAQRLYKEWFVDLRFPGWETMKIVDGLPVGWEKVSVGDILKKVSRTKQIRTADYLQDGNIPVIAQSRNSIAGYTNDMEAMVVPDEPIIVFGDHTRILKLISFPFAKWADGTQLVVSGERRMPQRLLYCSLVNIDLSNYHYARHFKYLKAEEILMSTLDTANSFEKIATGFFSKIETCREQTIRASQARDRLLPKLMSGELEV